MTDNETSAQLTRIIEQQAEIIDELRTQQRANKASKDFWDRMMTVSPIVSAIIIACVGSYFTYTYNQQQLKVQEIQTIEKFIPHLVGDEKSKRAAILAISSLGNDNLAARVASIFASEGTASALQSIAQKSNPKDKQVVQEALYSTLEALADKYRDGNNFEEAIQTIKRELALKESAFGKNSPELSESVARLGALYELHGQHDLAELEFSRLADLKRNANSNPADQSAAANLDEPKSQPQSASDSTDKTGLDAVSGQKNENELAVAEKVKPAGKLAPDVKPTAGSGGSGNNSSSQNDGHSSGQ